MNRVPRPKKCKACGEKFQPRAALQVACSVPCAIQHGRKAQAKKVRTETRAAKVRLMTRSDWIKKAQVAFNRYIRLRDQHRPCICCGRPLSAGGLTGGGYDAGHYRSVGSAPHLRFHEDNCHAQRKVCNQFGSGRAVDYRLGLIARIGVERVEALESDQQPRKYSIEELQGIERRYKALAREIESPAGERNGEEAKGKAAEVGLQAGGAGARPA